jgi:hypothetical protein
VTISQAVPSLADTWPGPGLPSGRATQVIVEMTWVSPGLVIAKIENRTLRVGGEAIIEGPVNFVIYARYLTHWEDGTPIGDDEKAIVLDRVVDASADRGWTFEIEWR